MKLMAIHGGLALQTILKTSDHLRQIRKSDLEPGDWLFVKTVRSVYRIHVLRNGLYEASGGWFDKKGLSPMRVRIAGCSWGGSIIKTGVVAVCGLSLEFSNRLITSAIQRVILVRARCLN
jgi:hypothetical protein